MDAFRRPKGSFVFIKNIKVLVLGVAAFLSVFCFAEDTNDVIGNSAKHGRLLIERWRESLNRMPVGTRFTIPPESEKKKGYFNVTQAYLDSKVIPFTDQRTFEVIPNELNHVCLECNNWKKIFYKNERLPPSSACEVLRKENQAGNKSLFPPHPETKQVGRPCDGGYLVRTKTGSLDNCYCMAEDLAENSFSNDLVPVANTCQFEFYNKKTGQRFPDQSFTANLLREVLDIVGKHFDTRSIPSEKAFVPKIPHNNSGTQEYFFRPREKMKFGQYTVSDLYTANGQNALPAGLEARLFCPDAPARLQEAKKTRLFTTSDFNTSACPCTSSVSSLPESLSLPAMERGFAKLGHFGENTTYKLVDESLLPKELRKKTTSPVRRTGYGVTDNSPPGDNAGFAAIRRKDGGSTGRANLGVNGTGVGTLNNPVTAAISPAFARKYGVCQGDMLYDANYGWLRVEGGCTNNIFNGKFLGERVDIWRGGLSKQEKGLNVKVNFIHFPAALIDKDFAQNYPGPVRRVK